MYKVASWRMNFEHKIFIYKIFVGHYDGNIALQY